MKIRKAVFPAAGLGTRFLPATKAQPKEMLPLVDKPIIQYGVEEALAAGCNGYLVKPFRRQEPGLPSPAVPQLRVRVPCVGSAVSRGGDRLPRRRVPRYVVAYDGRRDALREERRRLRRLSDRG